MERIMNELANSESIIYNWQDKIIENKMYDASTHITKIEDGSIFIRKTNDDIQIKVNGISIENNQNVLIEKEDLIQVYYKGELVGVANDNNTTVKLPLGKPMVNTFPYFTGLNSILKAYNKDEVWVYNNYFLMWMFKFIHFNEYWADFKFGNEEKQECFCCQIDKKIVKREYVNEPQSFVKQCINDKKYIFLSMDMYYVPEWWGNFNKIHLKHQVYISGYNDEKQFFLLSGFMNGFFKTVKISYNDFDKSYDDWKKDSTKCLKEFANDIWLLSINSKDEKLDIKRIIDWCRDSIDGTDLRIENYLWWEQKAEDIAYGINYFDEYIKAMDELNEESDFDIIPLHILTEFGAVMENRIKYMLKYFKLDEDKYSQLLEATGSYKLISKKNENLGLRFILNKNMKYLDCIKKNLHKQKEIYGSIIEEFLDLCNEIYSC